MGCIKFWYDRHLKQKQKEEAMSILKKGIPAKWLESERICCNATRDWMKSEILTITFQPSPVKIQVNRKSICQPVIPS